MNKTDHFKSFGSLARSQAGLSLVELMISITIGLILLAGISMLIAKQSSTSTELEKSSRQIENGRYAMELLRNDIRLAGYYGDLDVKNTNPDVTLDPCSTDPANLGWIAGTAVPVPVFGYPNAATAGLTCLQSPAAGTAALVIRRTATETFTVAAAAGATTYLQVSRCSADAGPFLIGQASATVFNLRQNNCLDLALLRKYIVRVYYISSCDVCGSDTIPTLKMYEFVDGGGTTRPLVEGIENMQFDYGIDNVNPRDGSPDVYTAAPTNAEWLDVMAVRVNLLARNIDPTAGYLDSKTYNLGLAASAVVPTDSSYKRHVYSEVVRAINPSGRREM